MDPKAERKSKTLLVRNLAFEPGFDDYDALLPARVRAIHRFAAFNGCEEVCIEKTAPRKVKAALMRALTLDQTL